MRRFTATMDHLAKIITYVVMIIILFPITKVIVLYTKEHDLKLLLVPLFVFVVLGVAALFRTKEYGLDAEGLHIYRPSGEVKFPLHRFRSIASVTSKELGFGVRTFGSGGFFGYFGKFYYKKIGAATLYVTDREKMLLITLDDDRKIIISPDDTAGFMAAFQELTKR